MIEIVLLTFCSIFVVECINLFTEIKRNSIIKKLSKVSKKYDNNS